LREIIIVCPTESQRLRRAISLAVASYLRSKTVNKINGQPIAGDTTSLVVTMGAFLENGERSTGRLMRETLKRVNPEILNPILCCFDTNGSSPKHEKPIADFQVLKELVGNWIDPETTLVLFLAKTDYLPPIYCGLTNFGFDQPFRIHRVSYRGRTTGIPPHPLPSTEAFLSSIDQTASL